MDPYSVIIKPQLSEKTMNQIYDENKITFVVRCRRKYSYHS